MVLRSIETGIPFKDMSVYDIDMFLPVMELLSSVIPSVASQRIFADHVRSAFALIEEGLVPSNEGRGYVLRRLIRRGFFQWYKSARAAGSSIDLVSLRALLVSCMDHFNSVFDGKFTDHTLKVLYEEMVQFSKTIAVGEKLLGDIITGLSTQQIPGADVFKMYDTYGFPVELTQEIAHDAGLTVDTAGFKKSMEEARARSRA